MPQEIRDGRRCGMTDTHTEHEWCCYHASFDERMTVVAATREQAAVYYALWRMVPVEDVIARYVKTVTRVVRKAGAA